MAGPSIEDIVLTSVVVVGLGVTGRAVVRALREHGVGVIAVDDHPSEEVRAAAASLGVDLIEAPSEHALAGVLAGADALLPSPGVPDRHAAFAAAEQAGVPVLSEFDLAAGWDDRPVVAVTGTDGKTTVTTMVTDMLTASGRRAVACGNTETPLVEAIADRDAEVFVVEASSFRLGHTRRFVPDVAVWLNFAPDHLDVHASLASYEAAKARVWSDLAEDGLAVANAEDQVVLANRNADVQTVTFGPEGSGADATVVEGSLSLPDGTAILAVDELPRSLPHDVANSLAASVAAVAAGADIDAVRRVLREFTGLPHRVQLVAESEGVRWYDDSKATTPHATLAAVAGFESVVLLAGGRNKGLDLGPLADAVPPIRAVVAMGEAAPEVVDAFSGRCEVFVVTTGMADVVAEAGRLARPGDVVLLSPGCTSFDWFGSYSERGDAFAAEVRSVVGARGEVAP
jgi:UDP-N-acetylmuramoylalanine--D-glutamate ligase